MNPSILKNSGFSFLLFILITTCSANKSLEEEHQIAINEQALPEIVSLPILDSMVFGWNLYNNTSYNIIIDYYKYRGIDYINNINKNGKQLTIDTAMTNWLFRIAGFNNNYLLVGVVTKEDEMLTDFSYAYNIATDEKYKVQKYMADDILELEKGRYGIINTTNSDINSQLSFFESEHALYIYNKDTLLHYTELEKTRYQTVRFMFLSSNFIGIVSNKLKQKEGVLHIYDTKGNYIKHQTVPLEGLLNSKKRDKFLRLSEDSSAISVWQFNEKDTSLRKMCEYAIDNYTVVDYDFYKDSLYLILNIQNQGYWLNVLPINKSLSYNDFQTNLIETERLRYIYIDDIGITLSSHANNSREDNQAGNKERKELSKLGIKDEDCVQFRTCVSFQLRYFRKNHSVKHIESGSKNNYTILFENEYALPNCNAIPVKFDYGELLLSYYEFSVPRVDIKGIKINVGGYDYYYVPEKGLLWNNQSASVEKIKGDIKDAIEQSVNYYFLNNKNLNLYYK